MDLGIFLGADGKAVSVSQEASTRQGLADRRTNRMIPPCLRMSRNPSQPRQRPTTEGSISCHGTSDTLAYRCHTRGLRIRDRKLDRRTQKSAYSGSFALVRTWR